MYYRNGHYSNGCYGKRLRKKNKKKIKKIKKVLVIKKKLLIFAA